MWAVVINGAIRGLYQSQAEAENAFNAMSAPAITPQPRPGPTSTAGAFGNVNVDPATQFKMWAEEHALNVARLELERSNGDADRAYRAYAGTLGAWERMAEMFGFVPQGFDISPLAGLLGGGAGAFGAAAYGGAGGASGVGGTTSTGAAGTGSAALEAARKELINASGGNWAAGTYGPGTPGQTSIWASASPQMVANEYFKMTGKQIPGFTATADPLARFSPGQQSALQYIYSQRPDIAAHFAANPEVTGFRQGARYLVTDPNEQMATWGIWNPPEVQQAGGLEAYAKSLGWNGEVSAGAGGASGAGGAVSGGTGAGGAAGFLSALQGMPTLEARRFMMQARESPDILGSIRATAGLPYGVPSAAAGLPGWQEPYYGQTEKPSQMGGIVPMAAGGIVDDPTIALVGEAGPEMILPLRPEYQNEMMVTPQGRGMIGDPRFNELIRTPFAQALYQHYLSSGATSGTGRPAQGLGSDAALYLPSVNAIDYSWFSRQPPDVREAVRALYPGLTSAGFAQPFEQAVSSLRRGRSTAPRYA